MDEVVKSILGYGGIGAMLVALSYAIWAIVCWIGRKIEQVATWAGTRVEKLTTQWSENDERKTAAAEKTAETQQHLSLLMGGIDERGAAHSLAHRATLTALEKLAPPETHGAIAAAKEALK